MSDIGVPAVDIIRRVVESAGGDLTDLMFKIIESTKGTTVSFPGTATDTNQNVPSSDCNVIIEALIINNESQAARTLDVSFDDGTTFITIVGSSALTWEPKGDIKHLVIIRGGSTDVEFEVLLNRKP